MKVTANILRKKNQIAQKVNTKLKIKKRTFFSWDRSTSN